MSSLNLKTFDFNETPSQAGKTYLITGGASCLSSLHLSLLRRLILNLKRPGTGGLGAQSVVSLANHPSPPAHIYFSGRSAARAEEVIAKCPSSVQVTFLQADLASPASMKEAAQKFLQNESKLDVLLLNAGIMAVPFELNKEGVEIQFATNHVGHALVSPSPPSFQSTPFPDHHLWSLQLFRLLLQTLLATPDARVVSLTSQGYFLASKSGINMSTLDQPVSSVLGQDWGSYGRAKLANLVYGQEIARRYPQLTVANIHPGDPPRSTITGRLTLTLPDLAGVVSTDLVGHLSIWWRLFVWASQFGQLLTAEQGALNQLWACTAPTSDLKTGAYYEPLGKETKVDKTAGDVKLGTELWEWTEGALEKWLK